jgi:predicted NBD/HSP70 family sugar kinase
MPNYPKGNRDLIRALNRSAVLNAVMAKGPISRTATAEFTGLSAATVGGITAELIAEGLIFEKQTGDSRGGRRPILLALNPQGGYVVGIKLLETQAVGALTDMQATVITVHTERITDHSIEKTLDSLCRVVDELVRQGALESEKLLGIGIGLAGIVDPRQGILRHSPIFGWHDVPLVEMLQERLPAPVYLGNDVNTLTLTEKWFGVGRDVDDFLAVTIGRGVGLGIVLNGQIYRGFEGGGGEFGHTVIEPGGTLCACGNRGCLETFVADPSLLRMAAEAADSGELAAPVQSIDELQALAESGNQAARAIYNTAGRVLGQGIANLINVFNPQRIIISGEGVRAGELIFEPMHQAIEEHVMPGLAGSTQIEVDIWSDDAWARGAAGLVLQDLFRSPVHGDA